MRAWERIAGGVVLGHEIRLPLSFQGMLRVINLEALTEVNPQRGLYDNGVQKSVKWSYAHFTVHMLTITRCRA